MRSRPLTGVYINKLREIYARSTKQKSGIISQRNEGDNCSNDMLHLCPWSYLPNCIGTPAYFNANRIMVNT